MVAQRSLAGRRVNAIGLGCMNLSHAYGVPPTKEDASALLLRALDLGVDHFDTAALYGFGRNEDLVGEVLSPFRKRLFLSSKCGLTGVDGKRQLDGRPSALKQTCEEALRRLRTDHIDLYYLHRWDRRVPLAESVGALGDLLREGKIGAIGLSEVSGPMLRLAYREHPIAAVQSEYSLWTRNPEIRVLEECRAIGAAFVAFSPLGRGFLAGSVKSLKFADGDLRRPMPRFQQPNFKANNAVLATFRRLAKAHNLSPAQLSLAWLLKRGDNLHVIPGTTSLRHLKDNVATPEIDDELVRLAGAIIGRATIRGERYTSTVQAEIDTEEFDS